MAEDIDQKDMASQEDIRATPWADPAPPPITKTSYFFTTPRLNIRSPLTRDVPFLLHMFTNPANHTYETIDPGVSLEVYDQRVRDWHDNAEAGAQAFLIVCLKPESGAATDDDTPIGFSGYYNIKESGGPQEDGSTQPEVRKSGTGIFIDAPDYVHKGYAVEALWAVLEFGFASPSATAGAGLDLDEIEIGTLAENKPFQAVMRKMGLEDLGVDSIGGDAFEPHKGKKVVDWILGRGEWQRRFGTRSG